MLSDLPHREFGIHYPLVYPWITVTAYFQTSSKDILFSVSFSLPPFSCPSSLEYLCPRALILLKTWRYISRLLTYLLTYLAARFVWIIFRLQPRTAYAPISLVCDAHTINNSWQVHWHWWQYKSVSIAVCTCHIWAIVCRTAFSINQSSNHFTRSVTETQQCSTKTRSLNKTYQAH